MSDKLAEITEYFGKAYGDDAWSDFAIDRAKDLLNGLNAEEWKRLVETCDLRETKWQLRLIGALSLCESPRAIELLLSRLSSSEIEIAVAAAEGLESQSQHWAPKTAIRRLLQDLYDRVATEDKYVFAILLKRTPD